MWPAAISRRSCWARTCTRAVETSTQAGASSRSRRSRPGCHQPAAGTTSGSPTCPSRATSLRPSDSGPASRIGPSSSPAAASGRAPCPTFSCTTGQGTPGRSWPPSTTIVAIRLARRSRSATRPGCSSSVATGRLPGSSTPSRRARSARGSREADRGPSPLPRRSREEVCPRPDPLQGQRHPEAPPRQLEKDPAGGPKVCHTQAGEFLQLFELGRIGLGALTAGEGKRPGVHPHLPARLFQEPLRARSVEGREDAVDQVAIAWFLLPQQLAILLWDAPDQDLVDASVVSRAPGHRPRVLELLVGDHRQQRLREVVVDVRVHAEE